MEASTETVDTSVVGPEIRTVSKVEPETYDEIISYPVALGPGMSRVIESGTGPEVLLCLHGAGSRADRWRRNLPGLARRGFRAIAVDFPGHGFASKPGAYEYGAPAFASAITELLPRISSGARVTLVGTSLGGHVAGLVACEVADQVKALVLVGASGLVLRRPPRGSPPIADSTPEGVRAKLKFLVYDPDLVSERWISEEAAINSSPGAASALQAVNEYLLQKMESDSVGKRLADLGLPTLLIWGAEDQWVPVETGYEAAKVIPHAGLVILERAGHAPYYERPVAFNRVLSEFLEEPGRFAGTVERR